MAALPAGTASASNLDYCALFIPQQIAVLVKKPMKPVPPDPARPIRGCEWRSIDGKSRVIAEAAVGTGQKAYAGASPTGGRQAGALSQGMFYSVRVEPAIDEELVTAFLNEFILRSERAGRGTAQ